MLIQPNDARIILSTQHLGGEEQCRKNALLKDMIAVQELEPNYLCIKPLDNDTAIFVSFSILKNNIQTLFSEILIACLTIAQ